MFLNDDGLGFVCHYRNVSCSAPSVLRLGIDLRYRFRADRRFQPWLGMGMGYEIMSLDAQVRPLEMDDESERRVHQDWRGPEFLHVDAGMEYRLGRTRVGPFVSVSAARYTEHRVRSSSAASLYSADQRSSTSPSVESIDEALHHWIVFGIKAAWLGSPN